MIRAITILAAVVALAVSASPASAGNTKARTPKPSAVLMQESQKMQEMNQSLKPPRQFGNVDNIDPFVGMARAKGLDVAGHNVGFIKDGTSNTLLLVGQAKQNVRLSSRDEPETI